MITEARPPTCHCGNDWRARGSAIVGWLPCTCAGGAGHRTWECQRCGTLWSQPPHVDRRQELSQIEHPAGRRGASADG